MTLSELHDALMNRDRGMAGFEQFMQDCRSGIESDPGHAAAYRLLLSATSRFCDRYDREPMTLATAQAAKESLQKLTREARDAAVRGGADELKVLNAIAVADLG